MVSTKITILVIAIVIAVILAIADFITNVCYDEDFHLLKVASVVILIAFILILKIR